MQAVASQGRNDALGYRVPEAQRITYRKYHIADSGCVGIAKRYRLQVGQLDLQYRKVGGRVGADHHSIGRTTVVKHHLDGICSRNHVIIGKYVTLFGQNDAGAK